MADGTRKYPIENIAHARNALARVSAYGSPKEKAEVRRKVYARYPKLRDPVILAEKHAPTAEYAEQEAGKLRSEGYKVTVRPTVGEAAAGLLKGAIHKIRSRGGESE